MRHPDTPRARPWRRVRRSAAATARVLVRATRTLARSLPAATRRRSHSTGDRPVPHPDDTPTPRPPRARDTATRPAAADDRTSVRHVRIPDDAWRAAASRATREGYGVAELVRALVTAYGAGELEAPATASNRTDVRPLGADRTGVRPPPRASNGCSTDPASLAPAPARATTTTHHDHAAQEPRP